MFVRIVKVRKSGKTHEYAQIVESYRAESGMPSHRVLFGLGRIDSPDKRLLVDNLRAAFRASKDHEGVLAASQMGVAEAPSPQATLRYLDVAVVLSLLEQIGLTEVLGEVLATGDKQVEPAAVVAALITQRCLEPNSKLHAVRWTPRTALPELLGFHPSHFNNTRVHRVLEELDRATPELMEAMSHRRAERRGSFGCLYLDLTDTWFTADGPTLASKAKTKEGLVRRKIGIALLCDEQGFPLRWQVVSGKTAEPPTMVQVMEAAGQLPWLRDSPVVCDRAMGYTAHIKKMASTGLPFLTALNKVEFDSYAPNLPAIALALDEIEVSTKPQLEAAQEHAGQLVRARGMQRVDASLYVLELGEIEAPWCRTTTAVARPEQAVEDGAAEALRWGRRLEEACRSGGFQTFAAAARALGCTPAQGKMYRSMLRLAPELQQRVQEGEAAGHGLRKLRGIAQLDSVQAQVEAFDKLVSMRSRGGTPPPSSSRSDSTPTAPALATLRCAAYFNPQLFVQQRLQAARTREKLQAYVRELNRELARPESRKTEASVRRQLQERLRGAGLQEAFDIEVLKHARATGDRQRLDARLRLREPEYQQRRRYDGFSVLVAHPEVQGSAERLSRLYRAKDAVETDFQIIKSLVQLRPVRHRDNGKVRAHVTLCMLALMVHRTLREKLAGNHDASPELVFETLESCQLTQYRGRARAGRELYALTQPSDAQRKLLRSLGLPKLADPSLVPRTITPRSSL